MHVSRIAPKKGRRVKDTDVVGYALFNANNWFTVGGTFGRLQSVTLSSAAGPFQMDWADARVAFAGDPGMDVQPDYLHGGLSVSADTRNSAGHPTIGGLYRAAAAVYSDRDAGRYSFRRYEVEGEQFVPVAGSWWTLAAHGWAAFSETSNGRAVPFYMAHSLGGMNTLRGYDNYRFNGRNLLLASAESRWALLRDVDVAAFSTRATSRRGAPISTCTKRRGVVESGSTHAVRCCCEPTSPTAAKVFRCL